MAINSCLHCKPPKRQPGCHDHCPDYAKDKAAHDERKAKEDFARAVSSGVTAQRTRSVTKALKQKRWHERG